MFANNERLFSPISLLTISNIIDKSVSLNHSVRYSLVIFDQRHQSYISQQAPMNVSLHSRCNVSGEMGEAKYTEISVPIIR